MNHGSGYMGAFVYLVIKQLKKNQYQRLMPAYFFIRYPKMQKLNSIPA